jgi:hypothetical protein
MGGMISVAARHRVEKTPPRTPARPFKGYIRRFCYGRGMCG